MCETQAHRLAVLGVNFTMKLLDAAAAEDDISRISLTADPLPDVFLAMCEHADTPRTLACWLVFKYKEWEQLVNMGLDPHEYEPVYHPNTFKLDYLCRSFLLKFQDFDTGIDKELVAFTKWRAAEVNCSRINQVFRARWSGMSPSAMFPHHVEEVLHLARQKIRRVLGSVDYDYIRSHCRFGPGADLSTRGDNTSGYHKFSTDGSCTPGIVSLYDDIFSNEDADFRGEFVHRASFVRASRLSFVPKTAKTDRAICVEPRWNVFLQLGIGSLIERRLLRVGVNIHSQERNRDAARRAYTDGLATIDLSSASDCLSTNLIVDLLGDCDDGAWLDLLLNSRCVYTSYKNAEIRLEKISSMGNGYTFPLETLVFHCLASASMEIAGDGLRQSDDLCVYGDDIIVPRESAPLLLEVLECVGFLPNREKTYVTGNFYESCGKDFYRGTECRPIFVKKTVRTVVDAFTLCNQIAAYAVADCIGHGFASRQIWHFRECVIRRIPKRLRLFGPPEAGNGVIHASFDQARPSRARFGWEGYDVRAFVIKPTIKLGSNSQGHLFSKLQSSTRFTRHRVETRGDYSYTRRDRKSVV